MLKRAGRVNCVLKLMIMILLSIGIAGCSPEVPKIDTQIKSGLLYRKGDKKPFTGFVVGQSREGYRSDLCTYKKKYKDGLQHGRTQFWYPDGTLESIEPYSNGSLNGVVVRYYPNGRLKARIHLVNGMRGGDKGEIYYTPEGKVLR